MAGKWGFLVVIFALTTTLVNLAILAGQISTPAAARAAGAGKLFDDDDFAQGLTRFIRKTVRDYCTVGKKDSIDC
jgi:hypothetical protein